MVLRAHSESEEGGAAAIVLFVVGSVLAVGVWANALPQPRLLPTGAAEAVEGRQQFESTLIETSGMIVTFRPAPHACEGFERWTASAFSLDPLAPVRAEHFHSRASRTEVRWAGKMWRVDKAMLVRVKGFADGAVEYDLVRRAPVPATIPARLRVGTVGKAAALEAAAALRAARLGSTKACGPGRPGQASQQIGHAAPAARRRLTQLRRCGQLLPSGAVPS